MHFGSGKAFNTCLNEMVVTWPSASWLLVVSPTCATDTIASRSLQIDQGLRSPTAPRKCTLPMCTQGSPTSTRIGGETLLCGSLFFSHQRSPCGVGLAYINICSGTARPRVARCGSHVDTIEDHVHHDEHMVTHLRRGNDRLPPHPLEGEY